MASFDVGVRKYVENEEVKYWLMITAKPVQPENEENKLNKFRYPRHKPFSFLFSLIPDSLCWKIYIICTVYLNIVCYLTYFWIEASSLVVPVIVLMHLTCFFYWIDFLATILKRNTGRTNKMQKTLFLVMDGLSLIPLSVVYFLCVKKIDNLIFWLTRTNTLLRFYRIPLFLTQISSAEGYHWRLLIISYASYFILLMMAFANVFLYEVEEYTPINISDWGETIENKVATSLYIITELIFNVAYGDVRAVSYTQMALSALIMSTGASMTMGLFTGILTISFTNKSKNRENYRCEYEAAMNTFKERIIEKRVLDKMRDNMLMLWKYTEGYIGTPPIHILPLSLQKEIYFDINFGFLNRSLIFQMRPRSFLRSVARLMKHASHLPGDIILEPFGVEEAMICISTGVIEVLSEENDESPLLSLTTGTVLGEMSLFISRPISCFVRASTYVELQVLKKLDFYRLALEYPEIIRSMRSEIMNRIAFTQESENERNFKDIDMNFRQMEKRKRIKTFLQTWKEFNEQSIKDPHLTDYKLEILGLYVLSENIPRVKTLPIDIIKAKPWILRPNNHLTKFWDILISLVIIFVAIAYPLWAAYQRKITSGTYMALLIIKIIYLIDLYIECTTAIEKKDHFTYETSFKEIICYKLKTFGFYLDILATYYLSIYADLIWPGQSDYAHLLLSLNSLLKIWRLIYYFNKLENNMRVNLLFILTIKYIIVFTIMVIWGAVLLYIVACPGEFCFPERWFHQYEIKSNENNSEKSSRIPPLSVSLYFATMTLFTVGYGDIIPTTVPDCVAAAFCIIMGISLIIICTAEISSAFKHLARIRTAYQEDIFGVDRFMIEHDTPKELQKNVRNFLRLQWDYDRGYALRKHFKLEKVPNLQKRILLLHVTMAFFTTPLFRETSSEFLKILAKLSQIRLLPPHTDILQAGSYFRGMYVLECGYCQVSGKRDGNFYSKKIGPINSFGAVEMILGTPLELTVHSLTHVRVISLNYAAYLKAVTKYPSAKIQIEKILDTYRSKKNLSDLINTFDNALKEKTASTLINRNLVLTPFINVYKYQKGIRVSYWTPFEGWGKFQFLQIFILPFVVMPECLFVKILMSVRIISALLLAVVAPVQFCFPNHIKGFMIFITTQQGIAAVCLYLMLHVAYYDERGLLMFHPAKTAPRYLKGSFILDLITIFPYSLVRWLTLTDNNAPPNIFADGPGLILVLHLYKFIQGCHYLEENILRKTDKIKILKFIPLAFLLVNSISGIMILLSCYKITYVEDSKLPGGNRLAREYQKDVHLLCLRGPYKNETLNDERAFKMYLTTLYWVTSTMTNTGFGDIVAYKENTMIAVIVIVIFGLFFLSFMYANISSNMISTSVLITRHRSNILRMIKFMKQNKVNLELQQRLILHFEYNWQRTQGETPQIVFKNVNAVLRESLVASTYEDAIRQCKVFEKWEKVITRLIADNLNEIYFLRGEIIVRYNDILEHIYLIYRGKVNLMTKYGKLITSMGCGGLFGNISNKPFALSSEIVIAEENVDVLRLDRKVFFQFLQELPSATELITKLTSIKEGYIEPKAEETNEAALSTFKLNLFQLQADVIEFQSSGRGLQSNKSEFYLKRTIYKPKHKNLLSFIIIPESATHDAIAISVFILAYMSVCITAYMFAFQDIRIPILTASYLVDVTFILQIFLEFHISYFDKFGDCVISTKKIKARYLRSRKIIYDIGSIMPLELISFVKFDASFITSFRLNRMLRVHHIFEFYTRKDQNLMINKIYLQIAWILLMASLMIHIFACIWFIAVCPFGHWLEPNWVTEMNLLKREKWELYFYSMYHIIIITVTSGMQELQVYSVPEIVLNIIFMFVCRLSVVLLACLLGATINAQSLSLFSFQERIAELRSVFTRLNISQYQLAKMWNYVTALWLSERGKQIPKFISRAPYAMKCEVMYEMFGSHLSQSFIFSKMDTTFLRQLAVHLQRFVYFPGNYIIQQGDIDETMYFIHKGKVSVLTIHSDLMETIHFTLMENDHFGIKQGFIRGTPHIFSYRAETNVEIISLTFNRWKHLLKYFPESEQTINKTIETLPKENL